MNIYTFFLFTKHIKQNFILEMNSNDSNGSSINRDGLSQLSKIHYLRKVNLVFGCCFFQLGRSAENAKRIKNVQDKFVNSQVSFLFNKYF